MKSTRSSLAGAIILGFLCLQMPAAAQTSPIWSQEKVPNYLPHMTVPEVRDLLTRTDMVIIPVTALEQHGLHLPLGTDYYSGIERAKLIAARTDVLVAPILIPGQSPYHMGFEGTVSLSSETIQQVMVEAAESLIRHGFKRFLFLSAHGGNAAATTFIVDRINQETAGIAVDLGSAAGPFRDRERLSSIPDPGLFDRHAGVSETSRALFLMPDLVDLEAAVPAELTLPNHMQDMLPEVIAGDPTAHDQNTGVRPFGWDSFGMPSLSPFLSHGGVLRAPDRCTRLIADVADVAPDTLSDLIIPALVDLPRNEWIGNGRSCCSNQVDDALAHQP